MRAIRPDPNSNAYRNGDCYRNGYTNRDTHATSNTYTKNRSDSEKSTNARAATLGVSALRFAQRSGYRNCVNPSPEYL